MPYKDSNKAAEQKRKWRENNKEKHNASNRAYNKTKQGKECASRNNRKQGLRAEGWTVELYDATFSKQKGLCSICKVVLTTGDRKDPNRACADHKHSKPPVPREILCGMCNGGLGFFKDNPELLRVAALYLEKHNG
jgi:hypothetical protein